MIINSELLNNLEWKEIQKCWYAIPFLGKLLIPQIEAFMNEQADEFFDWDKFLLGLNFKLIGLENILKFELLSDKDFGLVTFLVYKKFETLLDDINKHRQILSKTYCVITDPYWEPCYGPIQAVTDLERILKDIKKEHGKEFVSINIQNQILDESNVNLLINIAKSISKKQKSNDWNDILKLVILLSFVELNEQEIGELIENLMNESLNKLIKLGLNKYYHPKILEAILRQIEKLNDDSWIIFLKEALEKENNFNLKLNILKTMKNIIKTKDTKNIYSLCLKEIILKEIDDNLEMGIFYYILREKAILLLEEIEGNNSINLLKSVINNEKISITPKLIAIKLLTKYGIYEGNNIVLQAFLLGIQKKYDRILELSLETIISLKDKTFIEPLLKGLDYLTNPEELKEFKYIGTNFIESECKGIVNALNSLGVEVSFNKVNGKWYLVDKK